MGAYTMDSHSTVLGSSIDIAYLITLFEWVSASFAFFYLDLPLDAKLAGHFKTAVATVWNLVLLIVILALQQKWDTPRNNVILAVVTLSATILTHCITHWCAVFSGSNQISPVVEDLFGSPEQVNKIRPDARVQRSSPLPVLPNPGQRFAPPSTAPNQQRAQIRLRYPVNLQCNSSVFLRVGESGAAGLPTREQTELPLQKQATADAVSPPDATTLRYLEYSITAPLLMLGTQSTIVMSGPIWALQVCYFSMMFCNLLGVAAHKAIMATTKGMVPPHLYGASVLFLVSSWLFFSAGWVHFLHFVHNMMQSLPSVAMSIIWLLVVFYLAFGIAGTVAFVQLYYNSRPSTQVLATLNTVFDVLSIVVKVSIAASILMSDELGPRSFCTTL